MPKPSLLVIGMIVAVAGVVLIGVTASAGAGGPNPLGVCIFGGGLALMGLDAIVTGQISQRVASRTVTTYGLIARLRGAMMVLGGLGIALVGLLELVGAISFESFINGHTGQGVLMIGGGLMLLLVGLGWLLSREPIVSSRALSTLLSLPARIAGLVLIVLSLGVIGLGVLRLGTPGTFKSFLEELLRSLVEGARG